VSKIGKVPVTIPEKVEVTINKDNVVIKGPKGELQQAIAPLVDVKKNDQQIEVVKKEDTKRSDAFQGLMQRLIANMVTGVTEGYEKQLEINGVGYRAQMKGNNLILNVGYSNEVTFTPPSDISISVDKNVITVKGIDKQQVGQTAAKIRKIREPDPYKHKGIKYVGEYLIKKVGKKGV